MTKSIPVPAELRNLQKCKACGFPVSQGRTLCVECEEKRWRGERLPQPSVDTGTQPQPEPPVMPATGDAPEIPALKDLPSGSPSDGTSDPTTKPAAGELAIAASVVEDLPQGVPQNVPADVPASDDSAPFLGSAVPSESWFAANKYILGALLIVAIVIGVIAWLR